MNRSQPRFEPACGDKQRGVTQHAGTQRMEVNGEMESCIWSMYNTFLSKHRGCSHVLKKKKNEIKENCILQSWFCVAQWRLQCQSRSNDFIQHFRFRRVSFKHNLCFCLQCRSQLWQTLTQSEEFPITTSAQTEVTIELTFRSTN